MLYLFDLDGTLIEGFLETDKATGKVVSRYEHPYERVELMPGVHWRLYALSRLAGTRFAICTNQGGVAYEYQTPNEVWIKMGKALDALDYFHGRPYSLHVAMHAPNATRPGYDNSEEIKRRKPNPAMLAEALLIHDPVDAVFVGDMENDKLAAERAGVRFEWAQEFFGG